MIQVHNHSTYSNLGCRCNICKKANTAYQRKAQARRIARPVPNHVHGTSNGYGNYACRCTDCTKAHRKDRAFWRSKRGSGTP